MSRLWGGLSPEDMAGARVAPSSSRLRAELAHQRSIRAEDPGESDVIPAAESSERFRMTVDEGGDWRVLLGGCTSLGHAGGAKAQVGIHGDLAPKHGELTAAESFHGGQGWLLKLTEGESAHAGGQPVGSSLALTHGMELRLGESSCFDVKRNDPASASLRLEPLEPTEVAGAGGLLLWFPGPGGSLRIGGDVQALIGIPGTIHPVLCEAGEGCLLLVCEGGFLGEEGSATERVIPLPIVKPTEVLARTCPGQAPVAICFLPWS